MPTILIIDDNETVRDGLAHTVKKLGHEAVTATGGVAGIEVFKAKRPDFVISDLKMDGPSGVDVLRAMTALDPDVPIMIITGFGSVETAVEAMKLGAFDFITKPIQPEVVRLKTERALELCAARRGRRKADALTDYLTAEADAHFPELVGNGEKMQAVRRTVEKIAASDTTVFICGESGTGKELVARAIHRLSKRAAGPFIKVNCGALTETLLESELFGHEKGAFTGAVKQKPGRFELADNGTLFLDEVGDVPPAMQVKLLRALQEREIIPVGGTTPIKIDCRLVAATNADLEREVAEGRFRADLYYRLNVIPVKLPPLRHRRDDIPVLVDHFLKKLAPQAGTKIITKDALEVLMKYDWPGNVRELENAIERSVILDEGGTIEVEDLPEKIRFGTTPKGSLVIDSPNMSLEELEREYILKVLDYTRWQKKRASEILGINASTLYRKLLAYGLEKQGERGRILPGPGHPEFDENDWNGGSEERTGTDNE
jgi:DNA-binding NtrC family response regulator